MGDIPLSKRCTKCKQVLPLSAFSRCPGRRDGRASRCKECTNKQQRERRREERKKRPPGPRERARLWSEANPGLKICTKCGQVKPLSAFDRSPRNKYGVTTHCKVCRAEDRKEAYDPAHSRAYYQEHGEKIRAHSRARARANPEENRRRAHQWQKDNPQRYRELQRARRARKRSNGGSFTVAEWLALCAAYDFRCACCGVLEQTVDHVIPVTKGGSSDIANIQPLCKPCNSAKGIKTTDYREEVQSWVS